MPYIEQVERSRLDELIKPIVEEFACVDIGTDGKVNYIITRIVDGILGCESYYMLNRAIGILECVKQEFYRRVVARYEDKKCKENGDVFQ